LFNERPLTFEVNKNYIDENGRKVEGPEQFIRLMLGLDGTLWTNNKNGNALFIFQPSYADTEFALRQSDIKTQTVYRPTGKIAIAEVVEGNVTIESKNNILLQAQNGISFPKGFAVKKGAGLLCRTGY